jgi:two-component system, cell cycle sensor histidine kinase and response regulator CckA
MTPVHGKRMGLAALGLSLLTLLAVGLLSFREWQAFRKGAADVVRFRQVLQLNRGLLAHVSIAESSQRGFLLTGRPDYLAPHDSAVAQIPAELERLAALTGDDQFAAGRVEELRPLVRDKLDELRRTIQVRRTKGLAAALEIVDTDVGKELMERIRSLCLSIETEQYEAHERSWSELASGAAVARWFGWLGALTLAAFIAAGGLALGRAAAAQEALTASADAASSLLRTTLYSIGDGVISTDAQGLVRMMNPIAERLTGYSETEALGLPAERVFHIVDAKTRAEAESPIRRVLREGRVAGLANHTALISRGGEDVPIDDSGAPIRAGGGEIQGVVLVFRDVTERKRAEEALRESERRFRTVADSAPVMIWSETPEGRRDYFNRRWLEFRGRPLELETGEGWKEGIHPDDVARHVEMLRRSVEPHQPFALEYRLRRAGGSYAWVLSHGTPRFDADGQFLGYIGSCVDIDDRKRAEEKLWRTAKLESLGVLAGGVAHDFNNLLVGILGSASLLEEYIPKERDARELLDSIRTAGERAARLTKQMLAYSGRGRFAVEPLDLSAQVRQIASLIEASIPTNVDLRFVLADGLPAVQGDASQIQQLIMNLTINAVEALEPSGGLVEVLTAVQTADAGAVVDAATAEALPPGAYVTLAVSDNGPGMDRETLTKIFDPFFTTKFMGRGLGLPSVSGITRGHGGAIAVDSTPGKGTTFRAFFPIAAARTR